MIGNEKAGKKYKKETISKKFDEVMRVVQVKDGDGVKFNKEGVMYLKIYRPKVQFKGQHFLALEKAYLNKLQTGHIRKYRGVEYCEQKLAQYDSLTYDEKCEEFKYIVANFRLLLEVRNEYRHKIEVYELLSKEEREEVDNFVRDYQQYKYYKDEPKFEEALLEAKARLSEKLKNSGDLGCNAEQVFMEPCNNGVKQDVKGENDRTAVLNEKIYQEIKSRYLGKACESKKAQFANLSFGDRTELLSAQDDVIDSFVLEQFSKIENYQGLSYAEREALDELMAGCADSGRFGEVKQAWESAVENSNKAEKARRAQSVASAKQYKVALREAQKLESVQLSDDEVAEIRFSNAIEALNQDGLAMFDLMIDNVANALKSLDASKQLSKQEMMGMLLDFVGKCNKNLLVQDDVSGFILSEEQVRSAEAVRLSSRREQEEAQVLGGIADFYREL